MFALVVFLCIILFWFSAALFADWRPSTTKIYHEFHQTFGGASVMDYSTDGGAIWWKKWLLFPSISLLDQSEPDPIRAELSLKLHTFPDAVANQQAQEHRIQRLAKIQNVQYQARKNMITIRANSLQELLGTTQQIVQECSYSESPTRTTIKAQLQAYAENLLP